MSFSAHDFEAFEAANGLRFTWNEFPATKVDAARVVVPIAALYTPMKHIAHIPSAMDYDPARCKNPKCGAVMNPYW
jgi:protein transport protein SEC23